MLWLNLSFLSLLVVLGPTYQAHWPNSFVMRGRQLLGKMDISQVTEVECLVFCSSDDDCYAMHFIAPQRNYDESSKGICAKFKKGDISGYVKNPLAMTYYIYRNNTFYCDVKPCENGGSCRNISVPQGTMKGYKCDCPCGWCGPRCEGFYSTFQEFCPLKTENDFDCLYACGQVPGCHSAYYDSTDKSCYLNTITKDILKQNICHSSSKKVSLLSLDCDCRN